MTFLQRPRIPCSSLRPASAAAALAVALLAGCAAPVPRDINGSPATARLMPNGVPPAPATAEEKQRITELNKEVLRVQEDAIARQQQAEAWAYYAYPNTNWNLYYGGWGGGHWGGGVGVSGPRYWGGYPYWW